MNAHPEELTRLYDDCRFESCPQEVRHPDSFCGNLEAEQGFAEPRANLHGYFAAVTGMDRALGRVLAALDRLQLSRDTLVVFMSDNGMNCGHHGIWGKGNGTFPQNMYDTSVKVPFIAAHPNRIPQGRIVDRLTSGYDVVPTLLDYLGVDWVQPARLPGSSFRQVLEGGDSAGDSAVVVFDEYGPVRMIRTQRWKYVHRHPYGPHLLFDLVRDPAEHDNAVDDEAHADVLADLRLRLEQWFAKYADPARSGAHQAVWGRGQLNAVGAAGKGRPAFAQKAPSGAFARKTYGEYVDIAEANRKRT